MRLFIAEKPSMALEIAKNLPGPLKRQDGYFETGAGLVTWLYGHVLRLAEPQEYNEQYRQWRIADLPIVPKEWKLFVADSCKKQFAVVKKLAKSATEIVHAGDPDREGQLLVDEVIQYIGGQAGKPTLRLLLNALDERSVKKALANLRENREFRPLMEAAQARQRADWLIGMNLSRFFTLAAQEGGHSRSFPVGRVKTPTLAIIVRREREINDFSPVNHFGIDAVLSTTSVLSTIFSAKWQIPENSQGVDKEGRLIDEAAAQRVLLQFKQSAGTLGTIASCSTEKKEEAAPLPPSLSALQILAGKKFGYSPQEVLDAAQELYEKKLTSYPRSDCEYLPTSQFADATAIIGQLAASMPEIAGWIKEANPNFKSRAWNDKKISAHHAIIPTGVAGDLSKLSEPQRQIYLLIVRAYLAQFHPLHQYNQTAVEIDFDGHKFKTGGNVVLIPGWKLIYTDGEDEEIDEDDEEKSQKLPNLIEGEQVIFLDGTLRSKTTKPPKRFTQSSLIQAMRDIHKYVKSQNLKKTLQNASGIGTEATRSNIISELLKKQFIEEKKKLLIPTDAAYLLIDALPDELTWPDTTAQLERELEKIVDGKMTLSGFMQEEERSVRALCGQNVTIKPADGVLCPKCGKSLRRLKGKNGYFWGCNGYPQCKATFNDKDGKPNMSK